MKEAEASIRAAKRVNQLHNEIEALKAERDHWKANHDNQVARMQSIRGQWRHNYGNDIMKLIGEVQKVNQVNTTILHQRDSADETCKLLLNQLNDQTNLVNQQQVQIIELLHDLEEMRTRKDTTSDER